MGKTHDVKKVCVKSTKTNSNKKPTRKRDSKGESTLPTEFRLSSRVYFITYRGMTDSGQRILKQNLARYLLRQNPSDRTLRPQKYLVCEEMYDSGQPHFHAILVYPRRKQITSPDYYDFEGIHPNIQTMRNMKAALKYVYKQDPHPLTNMDVVQQHRVARAKDTSSLYELLQEAMKEDPVNFCVEDYCYRYGLAKQIYKANYTKAIRLIRMIQPAAARALLRSKPGIKFITPELIRQNLNEAQLQQFYSHPCYHKVVTHINQIYTYPNEDQASMAPSKTPHLLLVGDSSIGKSALVDHRPTPQYPYPGLMHYYACYHLSIGQKYFPPYRSFDYRLVRWNQFTIDSDMFPKRSYNRLLDYLEGAPSALPQKGRPPVQRQDNPKHILTSNRTLQEHICKTFRSQQSRSLARMNLGTRIQCVEVPRGKSLHFLRKLFVRRD